MPQKNIVRAILLVLIGVFGGIICDRHYQTSFPVFSIIFPIASILMAFEIIKRFSDTDEER